MSTSRREFSYKRVKHSVTREGDRLVIRVLKDGRWIVDDRPCDGVMKAAEKAIRKG